MAVSGSEITVEALQPGEAAAWTEFLGRSVNATLFHDLSFLDYHPVGKFAFRHLVFRRKGKIVALLPGGLTGEGGRVFSSPLGASFGGFVLLPGTSVETLTALVAALSSHAREQRWLGVEITLPPSNVDPEMGDAMSFSLFCGGYSLKHRWLCHGVDLQAGRPGQYAETFRGRQVTAVRAAAKEGLAGIETGIDGIELFLPLFRDTYARHGAQATHTEPELRDLLRRFPDRIGLHLAMFDGTAVAGVMVFRLTAAVATTFYICTGAEHARRNGAAFAIANAMDRLAASGVVHLDFGPSASDMNLNRGVAFFKEGLGARGSCRDRWRWNA